MYNNNNQVSFSQGGKSTSDIQSLVGKERNFRIEVTEPLSTETSTGLIQQYENCVSLTNILKRISINDVEISYSTNALYNYFNRNPEIEVYYAYCAMDEV